MRPGVAAGVPGAPGSAGLLAAVSLSVLAWAGARRAAPVAARALRRAGRVRRSYTGRWVPTGVGWVPAALGLAGMAALGAPGSALVPAAAAAGGWLDDVWPGPDRSVRGWAGHLRAALCERRLTSGTLKAVIVGMAAALGALARLRQESAGRAMWGALGTALTANALNQLDTRPGRAGQAFVLGMAWVAAAGEPRRRQRLAVWLPLVGAVMGYLPLDRAGDAMLGDVGANALGAALGTAAAELLDGRHLVRWTLLMAALNAAGDVLSLGRLVDRVAIAGREQTRGHRNRLPSWRPAVVAPS